MERKPFKDWISDKPDWFIIDLKENFQASVDYWRRQSKYPKLKHGFDYSLWF